MKKLGFGCMRLPVNGQQIDMDTFKKMIDRFMEKGFTYYDTSYVYHGGDSEKALKEALVNRYSRDAFTITTKSPVFMVDSQQKFFALLNEQLERLGTDYVDYYWLHAVNRDSYQKVQSLDLVSSLLEAKNAGKVKHIGLSYHDSPELLDQILTEHPELEYVQLQLNYFDWESPYVASRACYEVCRRHKKPVAVMEPVKGGQLAYLPENMTKVLTDCTPGFSVASWGIRFAASLENVFMVLSGMSDMAQLEDNTSYMEKFKALNAAETAALEKVTTALRSNMAYCPSDFTEAERVCPKHIGIVKIAEMLNDHEKMNGYTNTCIYYTTYLGNAGKAADCDKCGKCLAVSKGVNIPKMLETADKTITHF